MKVIIYLLLFTYSLYARIKKIYLVTLNRSINVPSLYVGLKPGWNIDIYNIQTMVSEKFSTNAVSQLTSKVRPVNFNWNTH